MEEELEEVMEEQKLRTETCVVIQHGMRAAAVEMQYAWLHAHHTV